MKTTQIFAFLLLLAFTTPALAQSPQLDWVRQFGTSGQDESLGVTIGGSGGIYITGLTYGDLDGNSNAGEGDAFLTKYDAEGNRVWTKLLGTDEHDKSRGVAADGLGGIYITGLAEQAEQSGAFLTKYDTAGNKVWTNNMGGGGS